MYEPTEQHEINSNLKQQIADINSNNDELKVKLYRKMHAVQTTLESVKKTGNNTFHKYKYATPEDSQDPIRIACNENGLLILGSVVESSIEPGRAKCVIELTVIDIDTGASHTSICPGTADDISYKENKPTGDKALAKAITLATKYAGRTLFFLPSEDDPDKSNSSHNKNGRYAASAAKGKKSSSPTDPRREELIEVSNAEMERLGWSRERGQAYLQKTFSEQFRGRLTVEQLESFCQYLKAQKAQD